MIIIKTVGIIAEYNPFHSGHEYHIRQSKSIFHSDCAVVIMSGCYVQRGAPAIVDKYTRAKCAILGGADLVIELPVVYSCASAQYFANGAVSILNRLGGIDSLAFGMESGTADDLSAITDVLLENPKDYSILYDDAIRMGMSAPAAREHALTSYLADYNKLVTLNLPNNILALEYTRAIKQFGSAIKPVSITRTGSNYHDEIPTNGYISATAARNMIIDKDTARLSEFIPDYSYKELTNALNNHGYVTIDDLSSILDYSIRCESHGLDNYMDINPSLANRIVEASRSNTNHSFTDYIEAVKSKDLTYTRISRALLHIILKITWDEMNAYSSQGYSQYARVLGFNSTGREYLSSIRKTSQIPIITKTADYTQLPPLGISMYEKDILASHIYRNIIYNKTGSSINDEFRTGPVIL